MTTQVWRVAATAMLLLAAGQAQSEETLRATQGVACTPDGASCSRFQGYVYVRRGNDAARPVGGWSGASAPGFGERRVYLNMGAAEAR